MMVRKSFLAFAVSLIAIFASLAGPAPSANALRVSGNTYYFNTFEQSVILSSGASYFAARWGCGPVCSMATSVAVAYLSRHGICPGDRYLKVVIVGVPISVSCVYLTGISYPYNPNGAGGNGGGGSWRGARSPY